MNKKGVFFTLDATIAMFVAVLLISMSLFYLGRIDLREINKNDLLDYSSSVMASAEEIGILNNVIVEDSAAEMDSFLGNTKNNTCFKVNFFDENMNELDFESIKGNCEEGSEKNIIFRSFIVNDSFYFAKMEAYYE